jgi:hypothetical protein
MSDLMRGAFEKVLLDISSIYEPMEGSQSIFEKERRKHVLEGRIIGYFGELVQTLNELHKRFKKLTFLLTYTSEVEAIALATGKPGVTKIDREKLNKAADAEGFEDRTYLEFLNNNFTLIRRKIMTALDQAFAGNLDKRRMFQRVLRALPKQKSVKRPKRILKDQQLTKIVESDNNCKDPQFKEATPPTKAELSHQFGFIDDEAWEELVDEYMSEFIPDFRDPGSIVDIFDKRKKATMDNTIFAWQQEQETVQDFVYQVRSAQVDAAKDQGITDYLWISIVDNKTDECCTWRDGLTTKEIERQLKSTRSGDECRAIVPPAHFNCRCALAPVTDDLPDTPPSNAGEFDKWLQG